MCHSTKDAGQKGDLGGEIQWDTLTPHSRCGHRINKHSKEIWGLAMWYRCPTLWCVGHTHSHSSCGSRVIDKVSADRLAKNKFWRHHKFDGALIVFIWGTGSQVLYRWRFTPVNSFVSRELGVGFYRHYGRCHSSALSIWTKVCQGWVPRRCWHFPSGYLDN